MVVFRPSVFNRYILAFDKRGLVQAPMKRGQGLPGVTGRFPFEESNDRHLRLLRARCKRPRRYRAADERDERASLHHSITSSARANIDGGTSRPSVLAVLMLTTSSNFVGC